MVRYFLVLGTVAKFNTLEKEAHKITAIKAKIAHCIKIGSGLYPPNFIDKNFEMGINKKTIPASIKVEIVLTSRSFFNFVIYKYNQKRGKKKIYLKFNKTTDTS